MLEDAQEDVLQKALRVTDRSVESIAAECGSSVAQVEVALHGHCGDQVLLGGIAAAVGLVSEAFLALPRYQPRPLSVTSIERMELPFGPYTVNAWLVTCDLGRVLIDSGCSPDSLAAALGERQMMPDLAFITHGHRDHLGGLPLLHDHEILVYGWEVEGTTEIKPGRDLPNAMTELRLHDLSGHFQPALGLELSGMEHPVIAVGDALFAGSMGKCSSPETFQLAVEKLKETLRGEPDETILLPGHGPSTTLGEERVSNPFLAGKI